MGLFFEPTQALQGGDDRAALTSWQTATAKAPSASSEAAER